METTYASLTRVPPHPSASLTVERKDPCVPRAHTSVKSSPVETSNSKFMRSLLACLLRSRSFPPNLALKTVSITSDPCPYTGIQDSDSDKSSKFGSCIRTSWISVREAVTALMIKEVGDRGSLPNEVIHINRYSPSHDKVIFSMFVNNGICSETPEAALVHHSGEKRKSLT